jgi:hypothetical protein
MNLSRTIKAINPSAEFKYDNEDFSTIEWLNGTTPIAEATVVAKQAELQADYDAKQYQRDRTKRPEDGGYPSIGDQLDDIYHNGIDGWKATIKATKDKYPKS